MLIEEQAKWHADNVRPANNADFEPRQRYELSLEQLQDAQWRA